MYRGYRMDYVLLISCRESKLPVLKGRLAPSCSFVTMLSLHIQYSSKKSNLVHASLWETRCLLEDISMQPSELLGVGFAPNMHTGKRIGLRLCRRNRYWINYSRSFISPMGRKRLNRPWWRSYAVEEFGKYCSKSSIRSLSKPKHQVLHATIAFFFQSYLGKKIRKRIVSIHPQNLQHLTCQIRRLPFTAVYSNSSKPTTTSKRHQITGNLVTLLERPGRNWALSPLATPNFYKAWKRSWPSTFCSTRWTLKRNHVVVSAARGPFEGFGRFC